MMLRQSPLRWLVLAGIMLFISGWLLDSVLGKRGIIHLTLGIPVHQIRSEGQSKENNVLNGDLGFVTQLDSLQLKTISPKYELQVREVNEGFSQEIHTNILPPSRLTAAFPLSQMKIRKIGDTEFRFRLKQFYPDFDFQYSYPENRDTIPPRAPGITMNLKTTGKEEVVTLLSNQPKLHRLDDVVHFGCSLEYFWTFSKDSLTQLNSDSGKIDNKIVFAGKDKKIYFHFNGKMDSAALAVNHFYPIPGKDSIGFTILQCFPDVKLLKAVPYSKSEKLDNPVAEVEVWKLGGGAQNVYVYPNAAGRHGGEWRVPGSDLLLTADISHEDLVDACTCVVSINDSIRQVKVTKVLNGHQVISYRGNNIQLSECGRDGLWANLEVWRAPGHYFKIAGAFLTLGALFMLAVRPGKRQ